MNDDWVLDSLVGFLNSSTWSCPIGTFTDKNCVVFDAGEENKFSYTDIHKEYQTLVENLLESFTSDLGISGDQFTHACSLLQSSKVGQDNEELFEQVLAADDFLLFKTTMVRRNIDLELQALTLIKKQMGHSPRPYDKERNENSSTNATRKSEGEDHERTFEEAVKMSEEQHKLECSLDDQELQRLIDKAKAESLKLYEQQQQKTEEEGEEGEGETGPSEGLQEDGATHTSLSERLETVVGEGEGEKCLGVGVEEEVTKQETEDKSVTAELPPVELTKTHPRSPSEAASEERLSVGHVKPGSCDAMKQWLEAARAGLDSGSAHTQRSPHTHTTAGPTPEQLKERELYLRRQRDHLLETTKKQRTPTSHSCRHTATAGSSRQPNSAPVTTAGSPGGRRRRSGGRERGERQGRNTGILSSAIAGSLKRV